MSEIIRSLSLLSLIVGLIGCVEDEHADDVALRSLEKGGEVDPNKDPE